MKTPIIPSDKERDRAIDLLLEGAYMVPTVTPNECHARVHDDCDGDRTQTLGVMIANDGDMHILLPSMRTGSLRFRTDAGGGMSHRTRNALMLLTEAIRRDNLERPQ